MPRYIDADAFVADYKGRLCTNCDNNNGKMCRACLVMDVLSDIKNSPTISPGEARGAGKWEQDSDGLDVCSECGEIALQRVFIKLPDKIVDLQMVRSKFCPSCGAKMEVRDD